MPCSRAQPSAIGPFLGSNREARGDQTRYFRGPLRYRNAGGHESRDLALGRAETAGDDRPGVAERLAGRGIAPTDESDDRHFGHVLGDEGGGFFLVGAADFAADHDRFASADRS